VFEISNIWENALDHSGYIDGAFVKGEGTTFAVENPSDETTVAQVTGLSATQVSRAIDSARSSFDSGMWSGLSMKERAAAMTRYSEALKTRADRLKELAIAEAGCPVSSNVMGAQVHAPLRMTDEIVDLFLRLPEHRGKPAADARAGEPLVHCPEPQTVAAAGRGLGDLGL
jgi:aldehyde dehydrogenase (NAD+)